MHLAIILQSFVADYRTNRTAAQGRTQGQTTRVCAHLTPLGDKRS